MKVLIYLIGGKQRRSSVNLPHLVARKGLGSKVVFKPRLEVGGVPVVTVIRIFVESMGIESLLAHNIGTVTLDRQDTPLDGLLAV